ncbi:MAG TPA: hypothetical protein VFZ49_00625 [Pyrinomonadaceae bacterium]
MSVENNEGPNGPAPESTPQPAPNYSALEKFIFEPDEFTNTIVPRQLDPVKVADLLLKKVKKETSLESWIQVERVADFYDTYEVVEPFKKFLDKKESGPEEVQRSSVIAKIIAILGEAGDREFATDYYKYLVQKIQSQEDFDYLVDLHMAIGLGGASGEIRKRYQEILSSLESRAGSDQQARVEFLDFKANVDRKISAAEQIQPMKDKVIAIPDRKARLDEEIKMYLRPPSGYDDYLRPFAVRRIKRETWAAQPAEQIRRPEDPPLRAEVAEAFRAFLAKIDEFQNLREGEKEAISLKILRAIKFFGGKVSSEEEARLRSERGRQIDVLANEGFLLPR